MFDPKKYNAPKVRHLPVILMLDVSGSMSGDKIERLYDAVVEMIGDFADQATNETMIDVAIFTFGAQVELHTKYTPVADLKKTGIPRFVASGMTPLGLCLTQAKDYIDDKDETVGSNYAPIAVLVSDGAPNDSWERPLEQFVRTGRSQKAQRIAVAIGSDADIVMLEKFAGDKNLVFYAEDAGGIAKCFQKVTMTVSKTAFSRNNGVPTNGAGFDKSRTKVSVTRKSIASVHPTSADDDNDDLEL